MALADKTSVEDGMVTVQRDWEIAITILVEDTPATELGHIVHTIVTRVRDLSLPDVRTLGIFFDDEPGFWVIQDHILHPDFNDQVLIAAMMPYIED
jgi:hypothetical protein